MHLFTQTHQSMHIGYSHCVRQQATCQVNATAINGSVVYSDYLSNSTALQQHPLTKSGTGSQQEANSWSMANSAACRKEEISFTMQLMKLPLRHKQYSVCVQAMVSTKAPVECDEGLLTKGEVKKNGEQLVYGVKSQYYTQTLGHEEQPTPSQQVTALQMFCSLTEGLVKVHSQVLTDLGIMQPHSQALPRPNTQ